MRRSLALLLVLPVIAGCAGLPTAPAPTESTPATETATPTEIPTPAATASPTEEPTPTVRQRSVSYVLHRGEIPAELDSVNLTMRIVFVENQEDMGPCWRSTYRGPYKPTPTPIALPEGECYRSAPTSIDLTQVNDTYSLDRVTVPGRFSAGHALIVTNVTATYQNGTRATAIKGIGGKRANVVEGHPDGPYHVELRLDSENEWYNYWLIAEPTK
jgi:hypothetical protein